MTSIRWLEARATLRDYVRHGLYADLPLGTDGARFARDRTEAAVDRTGTLDYDQATVTVPAAEYDRLLTDLARERRRVVVPEHALREILQEAYYGLARQTESGVILTIEGIARRALGLPMAPWKLDAGAPGQPGEGGERQ